MVSREDALRRALESASAPYLKRLGDPEPLVCSVPEAAHVLRTRIKPVRRPVEEGVVTTGPHMGNVS
jgi:hypothetical protein